MKKGFLHIAEIIIVSVLVFAILAQFYNIPRPTHEWSDTKLTMTAHDLLASMEKTGVDWSDHDKVNDTLYKALPRSMGYAVKLKGYVRPVTHVGCVCESQDYTFLLNNVIDNKTGVNAFNRIDRIFHIYRIDPPSLDLSPDGVHANYDTLLFWGIPSLDTQDQQDLRDYLSDGRGVVLFANLSVSDIAANMWIRNQLNVRPSGSTKPAGTVTGEFEYFDPTEKGFIVQRIFDNYPGHVPGSFGDFSSEAVFPDDDVEQKILVALNRDYIEGDETGKPIPLSIIDWNVEGNGRTAWMSGANMSLGGAENNDARRQLLKTLVAWTAAERNYDLIDTILATNSRASMRKSYNIDTYEPMWIELTVGYFF